MKYEKEILQSLLDKFQKRVDEGKAESSHRIFLKPSSVCKGYGGRNMNMQDMNDFDYAVESCAQKNFLKYHRTEGSALIDRIWLNMDAVRDIENFLQNQYSIIPKTSLFEKFQEEVRKEMRGSLTNAYGDILLHQSVHRLKKEEVSLSIDVIRMLGFLEKNQNNLYVREASMLVYGSSKYFEEPQRMSAVCRAVRNIDHADDLYEEKEDLVLEKYHVFNVDQELRLKGKLILHFNEIDIDVAKLKDGIAVSSSDLDSLCSVEVYAEKFMTIENKTSFERYQEERTACMYLGGYANRYQISFIKKVFQDNPGLQYLHFGDIDVGGLKIHQNLCRMTGMSFEMFHMGSEELNDPEYSRCLQKLSENDLVNLQSIENLPAYKDVIVTMKERGKLEQEIVSFFLSHRYLT